MTNSPPPTPTPQSELPLAAESTKWKSVDKSSNVTTDPSLLFPQDPPILPSPLPIMSMPMMISKERLRSWRLRLRWRWFCSSGLVLDFFLIAPDAPDVAAVEVDWLWVWSAAEFLPVRRESKARGAAVARRLTGLRMMLIKSLLSMWLVRQLSFFDGLRCSMMSGWLVVYWVEGFCEGWYWSFLWGWWIKSASKDDKGC